MYSTLSQIGNKSGKSMLRFGTAFIDKLNGMNPGLIRYPTPGYVVKGIVNNKSSAKFDTSSYIKSLEEVSNPNDMKLPESAENLASTSSNVPKAYNIVTVSDQEPDSKPATTKRIIPGMHARSRLKYRPTEDEIEREFGGDDRNQQLSNDVYNKLVRSKEGFKARTPGNQEPHGCSSCSVKSGGKLSPIMDPRFNLREVGKQLILLEDHLFHESKRCWDCIKKHALTIEGLLEEAITLDTKEVYRNIIMSTLKKFKASIKEFYSTKNFSKLASELRFVRKPLCVKFAEFC